MNMGEISKMEIKKNKYIYLVHKEDEYYTEEMDEIIQFASTDFEEAISKIPFEEENTNLQIFGMVNGGSTSEMNFIDFRSKGMEKYPPYPLTGDRDEWDKIVRCSLEWQTKHKEYLEETKRKAEENKAKLKEKRERKEYERLKAKFEGK